MAALNITVIGAGNGGQAFAGHFGMLGHKITLCDICVEKLTAIKKRGGVCLEGKLKGFGKVEVVTDDLRAALSGADLIMIATTADAHRALAFEMSKYLRDNQIVILNPGRTCGAVEFRHALSLCNFSKKIYLGEAQTLIYACRAKEDGCVTVIGVKDKVLFAALPAADTDYLLDVLNGIYPCFIKARNVMETSLENIGAVFHPAVVLFNAAAIERGSVFYFYRDMSPHVADFLSLLDAERLSIGKAFGLDLMRAEDWISYAYTDIPGASLCEKMKNNPAYNEILAPATIASRQLTEDIPTGILPFAELGGAAGVEVPLFRSLFNISSAFLKINFMENGRTLERLGLKGLSPKEIIAAL